MTGVFEVLASDHHEQVVASRKAVALTTKRVNERFSRFLLAAVNGEELRSRLALVKDDLRAVVTAACEETGYSDPDRLANIIISSYFDQPKYSTQRTASVQHEARRPKLCPYHKEVVDISLSSGDPKAGYETMASHAWGANHCDGEFEGACRFKREMVTADYWENRDKELQERREEREQQRAEEAELTGFDTPTEEPLSETHQEPVTEESSGDELVSLPGASDLLTEFGDGPDAGALAEVPMAMAASMVKEAPGSQHLPGASPKRNRQYEHIKENLLDSGDSEDDAKEEAARTVNKQRAEHGETKKSEALKTVDVTKGRSTPSPKMDKGKWNTLEVVETEQSGSPHPTKQIDPTEVIQRKNNDGVYNTEELKDIGENTTERVELPSDDKDAGFTTEKNLDQGGQSGTWTEGPKTAVASVTDDVTKNPIREILAENYDGFVPVGDVQQAAQHRY